MNLLLRGMAFWVFTFALVSCDQIVGIDPPRTQLISQTVFESEESATSAIVGLYSRMMQGNAQFGSSAMTLLPGLCADEFYNTTPGTYSEFAENAITSSNTMVRSNVWSAAYQLIYQANSIIEGIKGSHALSEQTQNQLRGEGLFIRAFCNFYLVNVFGDIPIVTTTDYLANTFSAREQADVVYRQIVMDLEEASTLLPVEYPEPGRTRPNRWAATALLSRVFLYMQDFGSAERLATELISRREYQLEDNPTDVFKNTSLETIWQLVPVHPGNNTWEGNLFVPFDNAIPTYVLRPGLINAFEEHDARMSSWTAEKTVGGVQYYYPFKYQVRASATLSEYYVVLRLAEQYLIRAEARIRQDMISEGVADLNVLRARASVSSSPGLTPIPMSISKSAALDDLFRERRIELLAEWGHRWFDLKRQGTAVEVLSAIKNNGIGRSDLLFPIPATEILRNTNLTQNEGY